MKCWIGLTYSSRDIIFKRKLTYALSGKQFSPSLPSERQQKWNRGGHVSRIKYDRWTYRTTFWYPPPHHNRNTVRNPPDGVTTNKFLGRNNFQKIAPNRGKNGSALGKHLLNMDQDDEGFALARKKSDNIVDFINKGILTSNSITAFAIIRLSSVDKTKK